MVTGPVSVCTVTDGMDLVMPTSFCAVAAPPAKLMAMAKTITFMAISSQMIGTFHPSVAADCPAVIDGFQILSGGQKKSAMIYAPCHRHYKRFFLSAPTRTMIEPPSEKTAPTKKTTPTKGRRSRYL
jgi:hypothetical protein